VTFGPGPPPGSHSLLGGKGGGARGSLSHFRGGGKQGGVRAPPLRKLAGRGKGREGGVARRKKGGLFFSFGRFVKTPNRGGGGGGGTGGGGRFLAPAAPRAKKTEIFLLVFWQKKKSQGAWGGRPGVYRHPLRGGGGRILKTGERKAPPFPGTPVFPPRPPSQKPGAPGADTRESCKTQGTTEFLGRGGGRGPREDWGRGGPGGFPSGGRKQSAVVIFGGVVWGVTPRGRPTGWWRCFSPQFPIGGAGGRGEKGGGGGFFSR